MEAEFFDETIASPIYPEQVLGCVKTADCATLMVWDDKKQPYGFVRLKPEMAQWLRDLADWLDQ